MFPVQFDGSGKPIQPLLIKRKHPNNKPATWYSKYDKTKKGPLTAKQIEEFFEHGYLVVDNLYSKKDIEKALKSVEEMVDNLAKKCFKSGKIKDLYANLPMDERLYKIKDEFPDAIIHFIKAGVMPMSFCNLHQNEKLLSMWEQLGFGPNIAAHCAWNLRVKVPQLPEAEVPWHQDNSYWEPRVWNWDYPIVTAWIPLVDATKDNGCLQFVKGSHKSGKVAPHTVPFHDTWYTDLSAQNISKELLNGEKMEKFTETVPCKTGGAILFGPHVVHRSITNNSKGVRWSCDFRFHTVPQK
eukprot:UN28527